MVARGSGERSGADSQDGDGGGRSLKDIVEKQSRIKKEVDSLVGATGRQGAPDLSGGRAAASSSSSEEEGSSISSTHPLGSSPDPPLGVVLTHVSADFDTLSSAVGLAKLRDSRLGAPCTFVVLPRGASPGVSHYVELHKNKFPIKKKQTIDLEKLKWIGVVDAQRRDRLADCHKWLDAAEDVVVVDHHVLNTSDIDATELIIEKVGATATIVAEMLEAESVKITEEDATLLALGIHADTGSLTFEATTPRDASALAYCLERGASQKVLAEYVNPNLTSDQRDVIARGMRDVRKVDAEGITVSCVHVSCDEYSPGMASCAKNVLDLTDSDVLFMAVSYIHGTKNPYRHVSVIGRAKPVKTVDLSDILTSSLGGGGHPKAASATFRMDQALSDPKLAALQAEDDVDGILDFLVQRVVKEQVPPQKTAKDVMKNAENVIFVRPGATMGEVGDLLERERLRACPVIGDEGRLMGVVSVTEVDVATIKGQLDRPVSGYMKLRSAVTLNTPVSECERILVEQGEGCIPVVANTKEPRKQWKLAGLITRATILKTHEFYRSQTVISPVTKYGVTPQKVQFNEAFLDRVHAAGKESSGENKGEEQDGGTGAEVS